MGEGKHDCNPSGTAAILQGQCGRESTSWRDVGGGGISSSISASHLVINLFLHKAAAGGFLSVPSI